MSEEEGTLSRFRGLHEVIETKRGLFSSLYADRGSHDWYTEETGGNVDTLRLTQVHRALQQLGVTFIPAYSPEARGRSERAFRMLQDRLPKELALAGITEMAAANRYLTEQFIPHYNERFMVRATEPGTASSRGSARISPRFCVCKTSGSWPRTIRCGIRARPYRVRKIRTGSMT